MNCRVYIRATTSDIQKTLGYRNPYYVQLHSPDISGKVHIRVLADLIALTICVYYHPCWHPARRGQIHHSIIWMIRIQRAPNVIEAETAIFMHYIFIMYYLLKRYYYGFRARLILVWLVPSEAVHSSMGNITDFVHGSKVYHVTVWLLTYLRRYSV